MRKGGICCPFVDARVEPARISRDALAQHGASGGEFLREWPRTAPAASKVTMQQRAAKAFHSDAQDTYFTPRIPPEVKEAIPLMAKLEHSQLRRVAARRRGSQRARAERDGHHRAPTRARLRRTIQNKTIQRKNRARSDCDVTRRRDCDALVTALYVMVRMARAHTKVRHTPEIIACAKSTERVLNNRVCLGHVWQIEKDLTEMHVPENLVKDIVKDIERFGSLKERAVLGHDDTSLCRPRSKPAPDFPRWLGCRFRSRAVLRTVPVFTIATLARHTQWRVDITISNSSLLRVMKPSIAHAGARARLFPTRAVR